MDRLFNNPYNSYTEAAIRVKGSLELISMLIVQTLLKYNMQKKKAAKIGIHYPPEDKL